MLLTQVVKQYAQRPVVRVSRRIVQGLAEAISAVIVATRSGSDITTADTKGSMRRFGVPWFPWSAAGGPSPIRTRLLTAGMDPVGSADSVCWVHASLRQLAPSGAALTWQAPTPAMVADLTDHCWTMSELWHDPVHLPIGVTPKRLGRPPKAGELPAMAVAE